MKAAVATLMCSVFISGIAHAGPAEENTYLAQKKAAMAKLKKSSKAGRLALLIVSSVCGRGDSSFGLGWGRC